MKLTLEHIFQQGFHSMKGGMGIRLLLVLILSIFLIACERDLSIEIDNKNPPSFRLTGSGKLIFFTVIEVHPDHPPIMGDPKLWEIKPIGEKPRISELPSITYGVVPTGFVQTIPESGAPPVLKENQTYQAGGPAAEANGGSIRFRIEGGKTVLVGR